MGSFDRFKAKANDTSSETEDYDDGDDSETLSV